MTSPYPVPVALVGLGDIALRAHLPALIAEPGLRLAAVVDPAPKARASAVAAARSAGVEVPAYDAAEAVLADAGVPAVVLATPPWVTTGLARAALLAGKFVLAEKPVATTSDAAAELTELPPDLVARLQVGATYRHDPAIGRLREWIAGGRLGSPILVRAHIYDEQRDPADQEHRDRIAATLDHGSPVLHEGAHVFDWLSYLLGTQPDTVDSAWSLRTAAESRTPNLVGARLRYPGTTVNPEGAVAVVEFGWLTDRLPACELTFLGDRGLARLDGATFDLTLESAEGTTAFRLPADRMTRSFAAQAARFAELASGTTSTPSPSLADGLAALRTSERVAAAAGARPQSPVAQEVSQ